MNYNIASRLLLINLMETNQERAKEDKRNEIGISHI